ncbi:MAG: ATP-binding cassette domain-containing protein, partial [Spirochaetaceae bacterium]|nr:ATP-binding cassette domain-containing protein [Spirochaetaceae bacterium]
MDRRLRARGRRDRHRHHRPPRAQAPARVRTQALRPPGRERRPLPRPFRLRALREAPRGDSGLRRPRRRDGLHRQHPLDLQGGGAEARPPLRDDAGLRGLGGLLRRLHRGHARPGRGRLSGQARRRPQVPQDLRRVARLRGGRDLRPRRALPRPPPRARGKEARPRDRQLPQRLRSLRRRRDQSAGRHPHQLPGQGRHAEHRGGLRAQRARLPRGRPGGGGAEVTHLLEARGLALAYGPRLVLEGASIALPGGGGRVVGLRGPNGAGKSTFLKACLGLHAPSRGEL